MSLNVSMEVSGFVRAMMAANMFQSSESILEFLEKPWCWDTEYDLWVHFHKPMDEDDEGFVGFYEELDKLVMS